jgi:hypothetical protein
MGTINKKIFYFCIVLVFILGVFLLLGRNISTNNIRYVKIAGQTIKVDLALTPETQAQGLSGRKTLKEDEGMLFIFAQPGRYSFWMKDMNFPIDIIWLNENLQVVFIEKNLLPASYPQTFTPLGTSKYVLEVQAGFAEKNNLEDGDSAQFLP